MRGSIRQQGKHSWQLRVDAGRDEQGRRKRQFETFRGTEKDAKKRLNALIVEIERGLYHQSGHLTVAQYLNQWLDGYVASNTSLRTAEGYRSIVNRRLIPGLGNIQLDKLKPQRIEEFYSELRKENLSERTIQHFHRVLSEALKHAQKHELIYRNPVSLADSPKPKNKQLRTLTPKELRTLLKVAENSPYYLIIKTALITGLRQAELLGLHWRDVDLERGTISVNQVLYKRNGTTIFKEPKTEHSRRLVTMNEELVTLLKAYKAEQGDIYLHLGQLPNDDRLVFYIEPDKVIDPCVLSHSFSKIVKQAGLKDFRFHDLRHQMASLMLKAGVHPKVVQERLGHASITTTLNTYSHILPGMQKDAVEMLDKVLAEDSGE